MCLSEGVEFEVANKTDRLLRYYKNCDKYDKVCVQILL